MTQPPSTANALVHGGLKAVGIGLLFFLTWLALASAAVYLFGKMLGALAGLAVLLGATTLIMRFADWDQVRADLEESDPP